jgi:acetamidase/formamidase
LPPDRHRADSVLSKHEAYQLVSIAGNVAITQLVDKPNVGVHVRLPKSLFTASRRAAP